MAILLPEPRQRFTDSNGNPLVGGQVFTYQAGSLAIFQTTWQNAAATIPNSNPIILDGRGEATIFWDGVYQIQVQDSGGNIIYTIDNVTGNDGAVTRPIIGTAGTNVVTATCTPQLRRYTPGMLFRYIPFAANTGPVTINVDGLGLIDILNPDGSNLVGGEFIAGIEYVLMLDSGGNDFIYVATWATSGTFQATLTGFAVPPVFNMNWIKIQRSVFTRVDTPQVSISNSTSMTLTGIPAGLAGVGGATNFQTIGAFSVTDNATLKYANGFIDSTGVAIGFELLQVSGTNIVLSATAFTAAGVKGLPAGTSFRWQTQG